jgi:hypothetical protein
LEAYQDRPVSGRQYHQEDVGKGAAEVGPVDVVAFLLGHVNLLAARAIDFDSRCADFLTHTDGEGVLALA